MSEQNTPRTLSKEEKTRIFKYCVEAMKDYAVHHKFIKVSGLRYDGEIPRSKCARGPEGWIQWRGQFTPRPGEDTSPIEGESRNLYSQRKLTFEDVGRSLGLYGIRIPETTRAPEPERPVSEFQPPVQANVMPPGPPAAGRHLQVPVQAGVLCSSCGAAVSPGVKFCVSCGALLEPAKLKIWAPEAPAKFCTQCGARATERAQFCSECGNFFSEPASAKIEERTSFCTQCGAKLAEGVRFCTECGKPA